MNVADNLKLIKNSLPAGVKLIAVSKFHPVEAIQSAYDTGHRQFGESKMQELAAKIDHLPKDIEWHFIGHLQRNKVKDVVSHVHTIHSVDSPRLFEEVCKQATKQKSVVCCLLQVHIADEDTKYGFSLDECIGMLDNEEWKSSKYAYIGGVMGMATNTDEEQQIREEFKTLKNIYDKLKDTYFANDERFKEISMGMSGDYQIAIEEGSTMIRVGSSIFGYREY